MRSVGTGPLARVCAAQPPLSACCALLCVCRRRGAERPRRVGLPPRGTDRRHARAAQADVPLHAPRHRGRLAGALAASLVACGGRGEREGSRRACVPLHAARHHGRLAGARSQAATPLGLALGGAGRMRHVVSPRRLGVCLQDPDYCDDLIDVFGEMAPKGSTVTFLLPRPPPSGLPSRKGQCTFK